MKTYHRNAIRRIYGTVIAGMLVLTAAIALVGIRPLHDYLEATHGRGIDHELDSALWTFNNIVEQHVQIAGQVASRTAIRRRQIAYLRGEVGLEEMIAFSRPKLADAVSPDGQIRGIARYAPDGTPLLEVGAIAPGEHGPACAGRAGGVALLAIRESGQGRELLYCSPILDREYGLVGYDLIAMSDATIRQFIADEANDITAYALATDGGEIAFRPPGPVRSRQFEALSAYLAGGESDPAFSIHTEATAVDWIRLLAVVDTDRFYAPVRSMTDRLLVSLPLAFVAVIALTTLTLRPLIRAHETSSRLAHHRKLYREMFSGSDAAMLLIDPADGRIVDANPAAAEFYGYPRDRLATMVIEQINTLDPAAIAREREKAQRRETNTFFFRHRLSSGEVRDVEIHSTPFDWEGRDLLFSIIHDVTERTRLEADLRQAKERLELALANSDQGLWDWDCATGEVWFSDRIQTMLGYEPGSWSPDIAEWESRLHPVDLPDVRRDLAAHLSGKAEGYDSEHRIRRGDGSYAWIQDKGRVVARSDLGTPLRMVGTHAEISRRKRLEAELIDARQTAESASRAKSEFIASMSHELRTPLNAVLGFSEIIEREMFGPAGNPRYRQYAADIHASGAHLIQLIDDLLDLAKIESGRFQLSPQPIELIGHISDCLRLVGERARNHGLHLEQDTDDGLPWLIADPRALRQMLFNLLSNAIKFTPRGGRVTVRAALRADGAVAIAVSDSGIGISQADQDRLFQPFARTPEAEKRQIEGTGLGLVLVKSIMERHGGRVDLQSAPGTGSIFSLVFPAGATLPAMMSGHSAEAC